MPTAAPEYSSQARSSVRDTHSTWCRATRNDSAGGSEPPLGEFARDVGVLGRAHPVVGNPLPAGLADVASAVERADVKRPEVAPVNLVVVPGHKSDSEEERNTFPNQ